MTHATPTLLYIDDDDALARLVTRGLSRLGFKCHVVCRSISCYK